MKMLITALFTTSFLMFSSVYAEIYTSDYDCNAAKAVGDFDEEVACYVSGNYSDDFYVTVGNRKLPSEYKSFAYNRDFAESAKEVTISRAEYSCKLDVTKGSLSDQYYYKIGSSDNSGNCVTVEEPYSSLRQ